MAPHPTATRRRALPSRSPRAPRGGLAARLLAWYDRHRRTLPWRSPPGATADPYAVWLSEVMLQQTTVAAVGPYFHDFLRRWPTVQSLAAAPLDDVLRAWAGLGYYARARNLHRCAQAVANEHAGRFPDTEAGLRALPGIGDYTAAAVAAIAFERPAVVMDGNIERVVARLFLVDEPLPAAKPRLKALTATLAPDARPGDFAQAMMDLGAAICTVRKPRCLLCPWVEDCRAHAAGRAEELPARLPKGEKPLRRGVAFWLMREDGAVLLRRREERGLLGGMVEVPSTEWRAAAWTAAEAERGAPAKTAWRRLDGLVRHGFTHFDLELELWAGRVSARSAAAIEAAIWSPLDRLSDHAFPSLMRKVVKHALAKA